MEKKTWDEFRSTGLFLFLNAFLHMFGWCIIIAKDDDTKEVISVYPARVSFRGFDEKSNTEAYKKLSVFMKDNAEELVKESES